MLKYLFFREGKFSKFFHLTSHTHLFLLLFGFSLLLFFLRYFLIFYFFRKKLHKNPLYWNESLLFWISAYGIYFWGCQFSSSKISNKKKAKLTKSESKNVLWNCATPFCYSSLFCENLNWKFTFQLFFWRNWIWIRNQEKYKNIPKIPRNTRK